MMSCGHAHRLMAKQIREILDRDEAAWLARHLQSCTKCSRRRAAIHRIGVGIARARRDTGAPPGIARPNVLDLLARAQSEHPEGGSRPWAGLVGPVLALCTVIAIVIAVAGLRFGVAWRPSIGPIASTGRGAPAQVQNDRRPSLVRPDVPKPSTAPFTGLRFTDSTTGPARSHDSEQGQPQVRITYVGVHPVVGNHDPS